MQRATRSFVYNYYVVIALIFQPTLFLGGALKSQCNDYTQCMDVYNLFVLETAYIGLCWYKLWADLLVKIFFVA